MRIKVTLGRNGEFFFEKEAEVTIDSYCLHLSVRLPAGVVVYCIYSMIEGSREIT